MKSKLKQTELGKLPEDWEIVRLGSIVEKMKAGGTPRRGIKEYWNGNIPFVLIEDMTSSGLYLSKTKEKISEEGLKNSSAWIVPKNTLLLSMYATIGSTTINKIRVATNQAIIAIIPKKDKLHTVFATWLLKFHAERLKSQNIQSTQKNVNRGIVESFKIPLPPLAEQKNIAFVLSSIQDAKEKTEQVIKALKETKKSLMKHLFTYGPVSIADKAKVKLKDTEIGRIPVEWDVVRLGDVGNFQYGFTETANQDKIGPKFLRITDINLDMSKIRWSKVPYCKIRNDEFKKYKLEKGDILIARIGATTGKTCIIENSPESVFASYLIRFKTNKLFSAFAYYFTISEIYWTQINSSKEGKLKKGVSSTLLKNFKIPVPPLATQQEIASMLSVVDERIEKEEAKREALGELFRSMLQNLMTAKIRVKDLVIEYEH